MKCPSRRLRHRVLSPFAVLPVRATTLVTTLTVTLAVTMGGCAHLPAPSSGTLDFVVIGDTPYDDIDRDMLKRALPQIKAANPPFVLHVGDTQSGGEVCGPPDEAFARLLADLKPIPVFYTPGDNEWTDCDRKTNPATDRKFSELDRLQTLRDRFFAAPAVTSRHWHYAQQPGAPENARFTRNGLVFVTLNEVGTNNGRDMVMGDDPAIASRAVNTRDRNNVDWLKAAFAEARRHKARAVVVVMQADMTDVPRAAFGIPCLDAVADNKRLCDGHLAVRTALVAEARAFAQPVILIHGDTKPFSLSQGDLKGRDATDQAANLWRLNAAGDAGSKGNESWGIRDVTSVRISLNKTAIVSAHGLTTGVTPSDH